MVTIEDIKEYLILEAPGQTDEFIQKLIERCTAQVKTYCNQGFEEGLPVDIQDIIIQMVCIKVDPNTRLKNGKTSQSMGQLSISYQTEIPKEFKSILNQYRKVKIL